MVIRLEGVRLLGRARTRAVSSGSSINLEACEMGGRHSLRHAWAVAFLVLATSSSGRVVRLLGVLHKSPPRSRVEALRHRHHVRVVVGSATHGFRRRWEGRIPPPAMPLGSDAWRRTRASSGQREVDCGREVMGCRSCPRRSTDRFESRPLEVSGPQCCSVCRSRLCLPCRLRTRRRCSAAGRVDPPHRCRLRGPARRLHLDTRSASRWDPHVSTSRPWRAPDHPAGALVARWRRLCLRLLCGFIHGLSS